MNNNYPEASTTTYWVTELNAPLGSVLTIHGRFPLARFMALEIYTSDQLVDFIDDSAIAPDPGENNPYVSGTRNGTYTVYVVFGERPANAPPNTIYSGTLTSTRLLYRVYHATDPLDPAGGATNPTLPALALNGQSMITCPVQPFIDPEDLTPWGRLDNGAWIGTTPKRRLAVTNPPAWSITDPYSAHYFPNGANYYMTALLSREFLRPKTTKDVYVVRFKAPTYPNTRNGEPVYLGRQVHFWSICSDDPYTTNVNRCISDDEAQLDPNGFATIVVSDPGARPSTTALTTFNARWLAWGALNRRSDVVYDRFGRAWGTGTPVHYYNILIYRQTLANDSFTQSAKSISQLPKDQQPAAMGAYWPVGGYCTKADFEARGFGCVAR